MSCSRDVEKAILDKAFEELVDNRNTFSRVSEDTIQINGRVDTSKTKAQHRQQARAIANNLISRTKESFQGMVNGYVTEHSEYDPLLVTFRVNPLYVQHEFSKINDKNYNESPTVSNEEERDNINNDSISANSNRFSLSANSIPTTGVFEKYIQFKRNSLNEYQRRLGQIKSDKAKKGVTNDDLVKLNKSERDIKLLVDGNRELGIEGLKDEIEKLEKEADINAVGYYAEKDIKRLDALSYSNDIDDIREAQGLVKFYESAGTFRKDQYNPFFSQEDMFVKDQNGKLSTTFGIDKATMDQFEDWKRIAGGFQNILDQKFEDITMNEINSNPLVKNTYGDKHFNIDEVTYKEKGLKDVDFMSMWTMDITHGIASHNGLIPQVMFSALVNSIESKSAWSRDIGEYVDKNNSKVQKALMDLGHNLQGLGILGIKGASFNLFKQISKEGNETNDLVQRHTKEYVDQKSKALYKFNKDFSAALTYQDYETRLRAINKAFENLKQWRINNSIIIDPSRLDDKNYQDELVKMLGQKGYEEEVAEQNRLTKEYEDYRQGLIDRQIVIEGKNTYDELSDESKNKIKLWENNYDPKRGYEDYHSVGGLFFGYRKSNSYMKYNNFVAREFKPNIIANIESDKYEISNSEVETGHLDKNYTAIQSNPVLADFYSKVKEFCETIYENLPYDIQEQTNVYTLPGLLKTSAELINDKSTNLLSSLSLAFRHMMDRLRTNFGVVKEGNIAYTTTDPITGKATYKVNDSFIRNNRRAINDRVLIERTKFLQAYNSTRKTGQLADIKYGTNVKLSKLNTSSLVQLAQYLHANITLDQIRSGDLSAIKSRLNGDVVDIGRLITDFSQHSIVQTQSFDLPKLMKYFSDMTMAYAARREALPILEIMKKHYEKIENPKTNKVGTGIFNKLEGKFAKIGVRTGAMKQMDNWFERVVLNNYENKHAGLLGKENKADGTIPKFGRNIYSSDERKEYNELQELIKNETNEKRKDQLISKREALGKTRTATALYDNMLNWIRTLRLGYNLSSMTTNFLEGVTSNMILGASDEYFDPKEIFYGYRVIKHSFIKNITFGYGETGLAKKNRSLVNKFDVIIDSRNELQKNSAGSYGDKLSWMNPFAGNQRVEYINQSPLMIAMLRTMKVKDKEGNESSVWDSYDNNGHLLDQFRTPENIENWEALEGDQYKIFKRKLGEIINLGHGNYDTLRGMMAKSNSMGKAGLMFKTWLPEALYWRFGKEQDNIGTGQIGVKGRYWSYGAGAAGVHGAAVGAAIFGPVGALVGWGIGATAGAAMGVDTGVGLLRETLDSTRLLIKKMIGMPINLIAGKQIIDISKKQLFEKGDYFNYNKSDKFTIQDQRNLNANMADIAIQLAWIGLMLMVKHMFWDDDDKAKDPERMAHNILVNKLMQLSSQASSYVNPKEMFNTVSSLAVVQYLGEVGKELVRVQKYYDGEDIIQTGIHVGESGLGNQTKKILLPGLFKEGLNPSKSMLGFGGMAQSVYPTDSPFQKYFHSDAYKDEHKNKTERSDRRRELADDEQFEGMDKDEKKKEINKIVNDELPTPKALEKLGETREEYLQDNQ